MNVSISGHHISVTDAMDKAVREKLEKVEGIESISRTYKHTKNIKI